MKKEKIRRKKKLEQWSPIMLCTVIGALLIIPAISVYFEISLIMAFAWSLFLITAFIVPVMVFYHAVIKTEKIKRIKRPKIKVKEKLKNIVGKIKSKVKTKGIRTRRLSMIKPRAIKRYGL